MTTWLPKWKQRSETTLEDHKTILKKSSDYKTLLFGDSILENMKKTRFNDIFIKNSVFIGACGGDGIEHMLYRIDNGFLELFSDLETIVILAGTNNIDAKNPDDIFEGFKVLLDTIRSKVPTIKNYIVLGLPPRWSGNPKKIKNIDRISALHQSVFEKVNKYNKLLSSLENVEYYDFTSDFLLNDGTLDPKYYVDHVHFCENPGYEVFGSRICDLIILKN